MAHATDVVGYAYEADVHCVDCAVKRFAGGSGLELPDNVIYTDEEGNEVSPIFNGEDAYEDCGECDGTGECETKCGKCGRDATHDCYPCDGTGKVGRHCGDCGEELVS